jgi:hypothetical protein
MPIDGLCLRLMGCSWCGKILHNNDWKNFVNNAVNQSQQPTRNKKVTTQTHRHSTWRIVAGGNKLE